MDKSPNTEPSRRYSRGGLGDALREAVREAKCPGAVAYVGAYDKEWLHEAEGFRQIVPKRERARKDTLYDLASLTKVIATTTAILLLHEDGVVDLDAPVSAYLPIPAFGRFTVRHCLTHTAGLNPGMPLYKECSSLNEMLQHYAELELSWEPGSRRRYSDVSFMILGKVVELAARDALDAFCMKRVFRPLQMEDTCFNPPKQWAARCAATEQCQWRGRVIRGVVHDENAYAVGGVSGHAGLFSTAADLARFCRAMLGGKLLKPETLAGMRRLGQVPTYPWQGLGWKLDPWASGSEGFLPSRAAIGHTGWTGTSLWMDFDSGVFAILLANTCHPSRDRRDSSTLRHVFYQAVAEAFYPDTANVHSGLDRLLWDDLGAIRGKRLAVLTNSAAVDQLNRPLLEVFSLEPSAAVQRIYSPEHGFNGKAEAGEHVASAAGAIPVTSLYGDREAPSRDELAGIDLFVVDLPDIGSRYYTYMATMKRCLAACGEAGVPVTVLDRPNPVGGSILEGPIAEQCGADVCCAPIPARHGMTLGELARFFASAMPKVPNLAISELDGWRRELFFAQCALPWMAPSPNMPDADTAVLYTGTCLFEGTNLNEGRGTGTPFQLIGAPWLDAQAVIDSVAQDDREGCTLEAVTYTPKAISGKASQPRFRDTVCAGIRLQVAEASRIRPFRLAVALVVAIRQRHHEFEMTDWFDTLAGTAALRRDIAKGLSAAAIVGAYDPALAAFDLARPKNY